VRGTRRVHPRCADGRKGVTLNPQTQNPKSQTLNLKFKTLNLRPYTLDPVM